MKFLAVASVGIVLGIGITNSSLAAQGRWTEGFGQGNLEYFIDQEGYRFYIGCPTIDGSEDGKSSVSLTRTDSSLEVQKFTITVNGISYEGPFSTNSRVDDNNFVSLLEELRKSDAIITFNGKKIKYPKSNSAKVIPSPKGKKFPCNLSF